MRGVAFSPVDLFVFGIPTRYPPLKNAHRPALLRMFFKRVLRLPAAWSLWLVFWLRSNSYFGFCGKVSSRAADRFSDMSAVLALLTVGFGQSCRLERFQIGISGYGCMVFNG